MKVPRHFKHLGEPTWTQFRTSYVPRPTEFGPNVERDLRPDPDFDLVATDFNDMASRLGL